MRLSKSRITTLDTHLAMQNESTLLLPCGTCIGCRTSRAREWAYRCWLELYEHDHAATVTLTYADEHLPSGLQKPHLQGYLKRLRSRREGTTVRFFASGEYGDTTERPHYHALIFGLHQDDPALIESWGKGHVHTDKVTPASVAYVAGYVAKKLGWQQEYDELIDTNTGEVLRERREPPFIQMSRRPGIGGEARRNRHAWRDTAIYHGNKIPVPRFLHKAWLDNATDDQKLKLQEEKQNSVRAITTQQLRAAELIASKLQLSKSQRRNKL